MIEREIKLAAEAGIVLPDLSDAAPGITVGPKATLQLDAVYYDTPTLALARWGVTLRSRIGEAGPVWTLKLPMTSSDSELSRHELMFDGPIGPVPPAVRQATRAYARSQTLGPVVRLQTERTQFVVEIGGRPIATVCDDTVIADGAAEPINIFREIEVELIESAPPEAIVAIMSRLRMAGCKDDEAPVPKAIRALGPRAFDPPDVTIPKVGKRASTGLLVRHTLSKSVSQLIGLHAKVCIGDDPEDLHQFRVASRRLRSDLRTFAPLLDGHLTTWLRDELRWLGTEIGIGRDADVLAEHLRSQLARLPDRDGKAVSSLLQHLKAATKDASAHVLATLGEDRYVALLDALVDVAREPRFAPAQSGVADRAGRPIFADIAHKPWRRLSRAVDALAPDAADHSYHAIRILAKRARYAAEAVAPLYGKDARRFARALADVQTVLGKYQDTTVAEAWLRQAAKEMPSTRLVAGELIAFERDDRVQLRAQFWKVWKKSSRHKLRKWLG
jgi:CHAD domain-containing protein